jgi:hypothetical protein
MVGDLEMVVVPYCPCLKSCCSQSRNASSGRTLKARVISKMKTCTMEGILRPFKWFSLLYRTSMKSGPAGNHARQLPEHAHNIDSLCRSSRTCYRLWGHRQKATDPPCNIRDEVKATYLKCCDVRRQGCTLTLMGSSLSILLFIGYPSVHTHCDCR